MSECERQRAVSTTSTKTKCNSRQVPCYACTGKQSKPVRRTQSSVASEPNDAQFSYVWNTNMLQRVKISEVSTSGMVLDGNPSNYGQQSTDALHPTHKIRNTQQKNPTAVQTHISTAAAAANDLATYVKSLSELA